MWYNYATTYHVGLKDEGKKVENRNRQDELHINYKCKTKPIGINIIITLMNRIKQERFRILIEVQYKIKNNLIRFYHFL